MRRFTLALGKFSKIRQDIHRFGASCHSVPSAKSPPRASHCLLLPGSRFKTVWNTVIIVMLLITVVILPYRLCFEPSTTQQWFIFELTLDLLFVVDIVINFTSAYYINDEKLVTSHSLIARHYLKTWFFIDLLALVPFQLIQADQRQSDQSYNKLFRLLRIPRLYRLLRIIRLIKMIRLFRSQTFVNKLVSQLKMTAGIARIISFVCAVLIILHLVGCLWYYLATLDPYDLNTWVHREYMVNKPNAEVYLTSVYFVFTTLTTVGYGDITPSTNPEKIFTIFLMGFGAGFYSYMIGSLTNVIATLDLRAANLQCRMNALHEFSKATNLPENLKARAKAFVEINYKQNIFNTLDMQSLMKEIPASLRAEVSKHLYSRVTDEIYFFQDKYPSFLAFVVPLLKVVRYHQLMFLYHEGDHSDEVFFILRGRVLLRAANGVAFRSYAQSSYFGEIEVLEREYRSCSVQVVSLEADLYLLSNEDFYTTLDRFPDVAAEVKEVAAAKKLKNEVDKAHALGLAPFEPDDDSVSLDSVVAFPENRRKSVIVEDSEFESNLKKRNETIWANAIGSNWHKHNTSYMDSNKTVIRKFLTRSYKQQKSVMGLNLSCERIRPIPRFTSLNPRQRSQSLIELECIESPLGTSDESQEIEACIEYEEKLRMGDQLLNFEEVVADSSIAINSTKSSQVNMSASLQELIRIYQSRL